MKRPVAVPETSRFIGLKFLFDLDFEFACRPVRQENNLRFQLLYRFSLYMQAETQTEISCSMTSVQSGSMHAHAVRVHAGQDLVPALKKAAQDAIEKSGCPSAFILSAVGSLEFARLRMANACRVGENPLKSPNEIRDWNQRLEIVSLTGTFSVNGEMHVHMSVSDKDGNVIGGHLMEGKIFTTLELVIGTIQGVKFTREIDDMTGFDELVVRAV